MGGHRIRPEVAPGQPIEPPKKPQERGIRWYETWNDHELIETLICDTVIYCIQYTPLKLNMAPKNGGWRTVHRIFSGSMFVLRVNGMSVRHLHWNTTTICAPEIEPMEVDSAQQVRSMGTCFDMKKHTVTLPLRNMEIQNGSKLE